MSFGPKTKNDSPFARLNRAAAHDRVVAWLEQQENDLRGGGYRTAQEFHQVDRIEFERILADLRTVLL